LGRRAWTAAGVGVLVVGACAGPRLPTADTSLAPDTAAPETTGALPSLVYPMPTDTTAGPPAPGPVDPRAELARLAIDDRPYTGPAYRREDWPHWKDPDGNGCDAREDALIAASVDKPHVSRGCKVTAGRWPLVYVPGETTDPGQVDVDHVVPLGNAARSGGGAWSTDQRARYANDPAVLWVVDDGANQSKGDRSPDVWRPQVRGVWCTYATRWLQIKVTYELTVTTAERDALGQMLEEC
jgi:hypothetical protein